MKNLGEWRGVGRVLFMWILVLSVPSLAFAGGAPARILRNTVEQLLKPGRAIVVTPQIHLSKQIWLAEHFELRGVNSMVIGSGKRTFDLHDIRIPPELLPSPSNQQKFLDAATGIKGQIPTRTGSQFGETWDVVKIDAPKLITGANQEALTRRFRTLNLDRRALELRREGDDVVMILRPKDYDGTIDFGVAALTLSLSEMTGMSTHDAFSIIEAEAMMWVYPEPPAILSPIGVQFWNTGRWMFNDLVAEILQHETLQLPLEAANDTILPFLDYLSRSGVNFSGSFSGLPSDLFTFGAESLAGHVSFALDDVIQTYEVVARSPNDILEFVNSNVDVPIQFELEWVPDSTIVPEFIDADIVVNKPLITEGGSYGCLYRSHTVLAEQGSTNKFFVGEGIQFAVLVIYNDGGDSHDATLFSSDTGASSRTISGGPQLLFNNHRGNAGFWAIVTDGACQVQIYTGCSLSLPDNNQTTRLEWPDDTGSPIHAYGQLDRNLRRNTFFVSGRQGQALSISAQPFRPVIGSPNYHVDILLRTADQPFQVPLLAKPSNPPTIPETYIQGHVLPRTSDFWEITVSTTHFVKDLEYMLTISTAALDIQGSTDDLEGVGVVGRVE